MENGRVAINSLNDKNVSFEQTFHYYEGAAGNNQEFSKRASGAFIFRPKQQEVKDFPAVRKHVAYNGIQSLLTEFITRTYTSSTKY